MFFCYLHIIIYRRFGVRKGESFLPVDITPTLTSTLTYNKFTYLDYVFLLSSHNHIQKIWRKKGESFLPVDITPTLKHRGGSMMFGGCFISFGTVNCNKRNNEIWNSIKILDETLQLSVQNFDLDRRFNFQQDNDHRHTSKSVTARL